MPPARVRRAAIAIPITASVVLAAIGIPALISAMVPDRVDRLPPAQVALDQIRPRGHPIAVLKHPTVLRRAPNGRPVAHLRTHTRWHSPRVFAVVGGQGRWLQVIATELPNGRPGWIPMGAASLVANPWSLRVDLSRRKVTVRKGGRVVRRFRVAVGRRRTPTPTGRFAVTDKLRITNATAAYGCCAIAISAHQRHLEPGWRGGDRVALHGTRLPQTLGQAASFGCLRARDRDARWLMRRVYLGTVVTIKR
jgi:hypothetical protein